MFKRVISSLLVAMVLLAYIPTPVFAANGVTSLRLIIKSDEKVVVLGNSDGTSFYSLSLEKDGVGGKTVWMSYRKDGAWTDQSNTWFKNDDPFFRSFGIQEYIDAYNVLKASRTYDLEKGFNAENILNIMNLEFGEEISNAQIGEADTRYLFEDAFVVAAVKKIMKLDNKANADSYIAQLNVTHEPTSYFYKFIQKIEGLSEVYTLAQLKTAMDAQLSSSVAETVSDATQDDLYNKYKNTFTATTVLDFTNKDQVTACLFLLSQPNMETVPTVRFINNALGIGLRPLESPSLPKTLATYLGKYYAYLDTSNLSDADKTRKKIEAQSIFKGRGSLFDDSSSAQYAALKTEYETATGLSLIITNSSPSTMTADENATLIANNELKEMLAVREALPVTDQMDTEFVQGLTLAGRLRYAYYAMSSNITELGDTNNSILLLSKTKVGRTYPRVFEPVVMKDKGIVQGQFYTDFMNVMNEIPNIAYECASGPLKSVVENEVQNSTASVLKYAQELRQAKAAVSFLESLPYDLSNAVSFWYADNADIGMSLENFYVKMMTLQLSGDLLDETIAVDKARPMTTFYDVVKDKLSTYLELGIAQSALYIPLQTNINELPAFSQISDADFFSEFLSRWGAYRKVLYIDTSVNSAVNYYRTDTTGKLRVVTLADLMNSDKDIMLYTDTTYYNMNKFLDLNEKARDYADKAQAKIDGTIDTAQEATEEVSDYYDLVTGKGGGSGEAIVSISKRELTQYIETKLVPKWESVIEKVSTYADAVKGFIFKSDIDSQFLTTDQVSELFASENYNEAIAFAVTSAIYRDKELALEISKNSVQPIFISSESLSDLEDTSPEAKSSYYNYLLLKNIDNNVKIEYKSTLDYSSPLYVDIFGNIITESGYVVVPALANATLNEVYTPYTNAFLSSYGTALKAPSTKKFMLDDLKDIFEVSADGSTVELRQLTEGGVIDIANVSSNSMETLVRLYTLARGHVIDGNFDTGRYFSNIVLEVLRGSPLSEIDKEAEGIKPPIAISKAGVAQAVKFEKLKEALDTKNQNNMLQIPNLAFMSGIEVVILFVYKITMLVVVLLIFAQIFMMGMTGRVSLLALGKMVLTIAVTFVLIYTLPVINEITYYNVNKALLQDETLKIAMLNLEKTESGVEIGMLDLQEPKNDTVLYLKVENLNIPWPSLFQDVVRSSALEGLSGIYESYAQSKLAYGVDEFTAKGNGLYVDIQTVFNSSTVVFEPDLQMMYQYIKGPIPTSFYTPYYVFLDSLIANTNEYNNEHKSYRYTTATYKSGVPKSIGFAKDYLTSEEFMGENSVDLFYLKQVYNLYLDFDYTSPFFEDQLKTMRNSLWYNDNLTPDEVISRIGKLDDDAKRFVATNKLLLGKISDETFLKMMAMAMAIQYNKLYGVGVANSIEIFNLSPEDIIRVSITNTETAMKGSPYSYARFVFENAGEPGVYAAAILEMVLFISGWVKPLVSLSIFLLFYVSIFIHRLVLGRSGANVKSYLTLTGLLVLINISYAFVLKLSTMLPSLGLPPTVCLFALILIHTLYIVLFLQLIFTAATNWRDLGYSTFRDKALEAREKLNPEYIRSKINQRREEPTNEGWEEYKMLKDNELQKVYTLTDEEEI